MTKIEKIRSNAEVHGVRWCVQWAIRTGINLDTVHFALTGRYRRSPRFNLGA